ncbi:ribonuclease H-like domain-containing protein [Tanacetum coccineum]
MRWYDSITTSGCRTRVKGECLAASSSSQNYVSSSNNNTRSSNEAVNAAYRSSKEIKTTEHRKVKKEYAVENITSTTLVSCDGLGGYDWSDQADKGPNYALMFIECEVVDNCKKGLGYEKYNAVPTPYTGNFMPPTPDLSFTGLDEFVNKPVVENRKSDEEVSKGNPQMDLQDQGVIDSGCSRHMTRNIVYILQEYEEIVGGLGYVAFGVNAKEEKSQEKCTIKNWDILRQFSVARTPQQNGVVKRRNRTLIEAARTMLADSKCPITILNTIDHLGKFDGKANEGFFVKYSLNSKAFRVCNSRTRIVEENLHIRFSKSTPNVVGTKASDNADQVRKETEPVKDYILLPLWSADPLFSRSKEFYDDGSKLQVIAGKKVNAVGGKKSIEFPVDPNMSALEDISIFDFSRDDEDVGPMADMNNLDTTIQVSPILTTRIHKDYPIDQVIRDVQSATQIRRISKNLEEQGKNPKRPKLPMGNNSYIALVDGKKVIITESTVRRDLQLEDEKVM